MSKYTSTAKSLNKTKTPQKKKIPGRTDMVENSAGGFGFSVGPWGMLDRFLILGSESNTYYATSKALTKANAKNILECIKLDGIRVIDRVVEISDSGRAPKNDPALFVLALALSFGDDATRKYAADNLPKVARTGTHLLHLADYTKSMRGWGRGIRTAFSNWYLGKDVRSLAMQLVKYRNRDGWTHRDVLRLAHPKASGAHKELLAYAVDKPYSFSGYDIDEFMTAVEEIKNTKDTKRAIDLIRINNLPREVVPTELWQSPEVWDALLPHMGLTAMIRNLATMTRVGLLTSSSSQTKFVIQKITNMDELKKARVHPITVLSNLRSYKSGVSTRGSNTWTPVTKIMDALDEAFYLSFGTVVPTGKRVVYGIDVSGSMTWGEIAGVPGLSPNVAAAALAMLAAQTEKDAWYLAFTSSGGGYYRSNGVTEVDVTKRHRLDTVCDTFQMRNFGGTDCALPILWATENDLEVDAFVTITDNETWAGDIHPTQALAKYRAKTGIDAKAVVIGMTATEFTIADPNDPNQMDVVGFDTAAPNIISDFIRG